MIRGPEMPSKKKHKNKNNVRSLPTQIKKIVQRMGFGTTAGCRGDHFVRHRTCSLPELLGEGFDITADGPTVDVKEALRQKQPQVRPARPHK